MNVTVITAVSPFLLIALGAFLWLSKQRQNLWLPTLGIVTAQLLCSLALLFTFNVDSPAVTLPLFGGFGISFRLNEFSALFSVIASFLWFISVVTSKEYFRDHSEHLARYYGSLIVTLGGTLGVFYAADMFTLFVFFEVMSLTSTFWVLHSGTKEALSAAKSYLCYGVFGGLMLLFGIFMSQLLPPDISARYATMSAFLMLIGFGAKAGVFMLHNWLPFAHTVSPSTVSGLLSGLLTKTGVYGIITVTLGQMADSVGWATLLLVLSVFGMIVGAVFAFMCSDLKKTLAYSSVSQIGFILWGVSLTSLLGDHNTFAAYGTVFHMVNHSLIKILLFSCAGVIYQNTHTLDLNKLKGYGKGKPWLMLLFGVGALSLMGVPLFSGYVSKTLLHEAMVELIHFGGLYEGFLQMFEYIFLLSGGFTFAYMLKLFICIFVSGEKPTEKGNYATKPTLIVLSVVGVTLVALGTLPNLLFGAIGEFTAHFMHTHATDSVHYFSLINLRGAAISIVIGLLLYFVVARRTVASDEHGYNSYGANEFSLDKSVYAPAVATLSFVFAIVARIFDVLTDAVVFLLNRLLFKSVQIPESFFVGKKNLFDPKRREIHVTYSLAYSLLLFGIGLIVTLTYLLYAVLVRG